MLKDLTMLSVNQISAQIKLIEMGKALNSIDYPLNIKVKTANTTMKTRSISNKELVEFGTSLKAKKSFVGSASRLWNQAPEVIKIATTIGKAKEAIKNYCKTLPF